MNRPNVVDAITYKIKSKFYKHSIFITLGYIKVDGQKKPIEIFINSKNLEISANNVILTRLISAIFRRNNDVSFIIEELMGINTIKDGVANGFLSDGKYIPSFYTEIAEVIEDFFKRIEYKTNLA